MIDAARIEQKPTDADPDCESAQELADLLQLESANPPNADDIHKMLLY
jgi:hypothetical protein